MVRTSAASSVVMVAVAFMPSFISSVASKEMETMYCVEPPLEVPMEETEVTVPEKVSPSMASSAI